MKKPKRLSEKPRRLGDIYCSPWCGGKCKWEAYKKAKKESAKLARRLGKGWRPHVWENLGWHWQVIRGEMSVNPNWASVNTWKSRISSYTAAFSGWSATMKTPEAAVKKTIKMAKGELRNLDKRIRAICG